MIVFLFSLFFSFSSAWCLEEGIIKLDQKVAPDEIINEFPGAVTVQYAIESIKDLIATPPLSERSSHGSITHEELEHSVVVYKPTWAVDLSKTYMSNKDFSTFMIEMKTEFAHLSVLVLSTVSLQIESWDHIFPYLQKDTFRYINVCGTTYANSGITPVLTSGSEKYSDKWTPLSLKLIFADKTYYKQLKKNMKWYIPFVDNKSLHDHWGEAHAAYYATDYKVIASAKPVRLITGDSDDESDLDCSFDNGDVIEGMKAISMLDKDKY